MSSFFHVFLLKIDDFNRGIFLLSRFLRTTGVPRAGYRQSVNEYEKPRFAGKSAGTGPFSSCSKNPNHGSL
jgi:hypothetical protein